MPLRDHKTLLIDGEPATAHELIQQAQDLDADFGSDGLLMTSEAAGILRRHDHTVEQRPAQEVTT